jgi:hypothetical protein
VNLHRSRALACRDVVASPLSGDLMRRAYSRWAVSGSLSYGRLPLLFGASDEGAGAVGSVRGL